MDFSTACVDEMPTDEFGDTPRTAEAAG